MLSWAFIVLQVAMAGTAIAMMRAYIWPNVHRLSSPALILDVWGPLILVLPMLFTAGTVGDSVRGGGWLPLAGPIICGSVASAFALFVYAGHREEASHGGGLRMTAVTVIVGITLLLLGAAHVMSIWIGQVCFALAAVVLWINTPEAESPSPDDPVQARVGWVTVTAFICAAVIGASYLLVDARLRPFSGMVMILFAALALLGAARAAGPQACLRLGLWAAGLGVLLGLGMLSIVRMVPQVLRTTGLFVTSESAAPAPGSHLIAHGFGTFAFEATALLVLPLLGLFMPHMSRRVRLIIAAAVLLASILLTVWRLSAM